MIDSDNFLPSSTWLREMVEPLADPEILGSEPIEFTYRRDDPLITRYCALMGLNDPVCFFLGNYDRRNRITGKWTGLDIPTEDRGTYLKFRLNPNAMPTIGANGTILRRSILQSAVEGDYLFDVDVLFELARQDRFFFAKVKNSIVHAFTGSVSGFARKQRRRIADYLYYQQQGQRQYSWQARNRAGLAKFVGSTVTLLPLIVQAYRGYRNQPDIAWSFHIPACVLTLVIYASTWIQVKLRHSSINTQRAGWRQW